MNKTPWEIEPALTKERLCHLARLLRDVRQGALTLYNPDEGDGPWSLGCRIYERTINIIQRESTDLPWLKVYRSDGLYFAIFIDDIPLRFYKGSIEEPTSRTLCQRLPEMMGTQLEFPFLQSEWFWRIAVEPDENGEVLRISIAQFEETGNHRYPWEIPIMEPISKIAPLTDFRPDATILDKPILSPLEDDVLERFDHAKED
jgi:hypothetical protein